MKKFTIYIVDQNNNRKSERVVEAENEVDATEKALNDYRKQYHITEEFNFWDYHSIHAYSEKPWWL